MSRIIHFCPMCGAKIAQRVMYGKTRPVCPSCGHIVFFDPKVAVVMLVLQAQQVLLVKRAVDPGKGKWALPAGFVDAGEDPQTAAVREVREETGLHIHIDTLLDVFPKMNDSGTADIVIAYQAHVLAGEIVPADDAEAADWFSADTLPELVFATTQTLIARWQANQL